MPLWSARSLNIHVTLTSNAQNAALEQASPLTIRIIHTCMSSLSYCENLNNCARF